MGSRSLSIFHILRICRNENYKYIIITDMLSIQISSPGKVELVEQEKPILLSDQVLIRIHYVGFCGSDLNTYLGRNPLAISPVIPEIGRAHV